MGGTGGCTANSSSGGLILYGCLILQGVSHRHVYVERLLKNVGARSRFLLFLLFLSIAAGDLAGDHPSVLFGS